MRFRSEGTTLVARRIGYFLVILLALALVWYGLMLLLLALGVSRDTVDGLSGYRTAYDELSAIGADDIGGRDRGLVAGIGAACFLIFGYLAWRCLPRASVRREDVVLPAEGPGSTHVRPRAVERVAEVAARADAGVGGASGHYDGRTVAVDVQVRDPRAVTATLDGARQRVTRALREHGLPDKEVSVTLTGLDRTTEKRAQ